MTKDRTDSPSGVLCLNKPSGLTSRGVVDRVVRPLGRKVKVGHAGTLDPLASGVLVVCVGAATRLIEYVQRQPKTYQTVILLGARSDTHDADGTITAVDDAIPSTVEAVALAVASQVGTIAQKPPEYSALKVNGRRAYDLARSGQAVDLAARPITVYRIDVLSYEWPRLTLEVHCGSGTYIRSIARDLGEALGCGGLVEVLRRTEIGAFRLAEAVDPMDLSAESIAEALRPSAEAVAALPMVSVSAAQVADLARGRSIVVTGLPADEVALLGPEGRLVAIGQADPVSGSVAPKRVLIGL